MLYQQKMDQFLTRMKSLGLPLRVELWNGSFTNLGSHPAVTLKLNSPRALRRFLSPTLDGLGCAYVEGELDIQGALPDIMQLASKLAAQGGRHALRRPKRWWHSKKIDAEAIAYHYDVSNEFYARWLDERMVYSCGYFRQQEDSLEAAQLQKIDHILTKMRLQPGDRLLDIGCGWGALIMRAAEKYGARAIGITLSKNQYELAKARIEAAGLVGRCEVFLEDYRDVIGRFDRISSVGMFEHVGLNNLGEYFNKINSLLCDDGVVMNHGITSVDPDSSESPFGGGEFIGRYVFPHGELPHVSLALREMAAAGLEVVDVENLRRHYAQTLWHWANRFEDAGDELRRLAGERRWRIWRMYLAGCAHGFEQHWVSIYQILAVKPGSRVLPMTREYIYGL